jgi:hypothetical protein
VEAFDRLLSRAVARRRARSRSLGEAVQKTADDLGLDPQRVWRHYEHATTPAQEDAIAFLTLDHGEPTLYSLLDPGASEFGLDRGDLVAAFERYKWILWKDGGVSPLT